jgi:hypothetical protein
MLWYMIYPIHTLQIYIGRNYTYITLLDTQDPYNILMIIDINFIYENAINLYTHTRLIY